MIWFTMANPTHSSAYKALHKRLTPATGNERPRLHEKLAILDPPVPNPMANLTQNPTPVPAIHHSPKPTLVRHRTKEVLLNRRNPPLMHSRNSAKMAS